MKSEGEEIEKQEQRGYPYAPQPTLSLILFVSGLVVIFGTGLWYLLRGTLPPDFGGSAAAAAGLFFILALILQAPALILDDSQKEGGEPSTMRILSLSIVLTFCLIMLRTAWIEKQLPPLEGQGNWVWLVTAALGGKALQKFAEVQEKGKEEEEKTRRLLNQGHEKR